MYLLGGGFFFLVVFQFVGRSELKFVKEIGGAVMLKVEYNDCDQIVVSLLRFTV